MSKRAWDIAEAFRQAFVALPAYDGISCDNGQNGDIIDRTGGQLVFAARDKPLNDTATALGYTLHLTVATRAQRVNKTDPDPALAHASLVDQVSDTLNGSGKAALLSALQALGTFSFRGWSSTETEPGVETHHFKTPLAIAGALLVL